MRNLSSANIYVAIVDDDDGLRRSFSRLLRVAGFQPITYPSAEALLEDDKHPRFDCLVLDIQLTGMSGLELAQRLVAVRDHTPIIFITAHDDPETCRQAEIAGCAGYFRKTDPGQVIIQKIRHVAGVADESTRGRKTDSTNTQERTEHPA